MEINKKSFIQGDKIDVVYTWVNAADEKWLQKKRQARLEYGRELSLEEEKGRYEDHNELMYSLRSIEQYLPWVNRIFIITDNQIPNWIDVSNKKIQIIDHKEIFPEFVKTPIFNSRVIEWFLHRIPNLSEKFIYFNDDMLVNKELLEEDFFDTEGRRIHYVIKQDLLRERHGINLKKNFDVLQSKDGLKNEGAVNSIMTYFKKREFSASSFYNSQDLFKLENPSFDDLYYVKHAPNGFSKKYLAKMYDKYEFFIKKMAKNQFREKNDIQMHGLVLLNEISEGLASLSMKNTDLFEFTMDANREKAEDIIELWNPAYKFLCVEDNSIKNSELSKIAFAALAIRFPERSSFEIEDGCDSINGEDAYALAKLFYNSIDEVKNSKAWKVNNFCQKIYRMMKKRLVVVKRLIK